MKHYAPTQHSPESFDESIDELADDPRDYDKWERLNDIRTRLAGQDNPVPKFKPGYGNE